MLLAEYVRAGVLHCLLVLVAAAAIAGLFIGLKAIWYLVDRCSRALGV